MRFYYIRNKSYLDYSQLQLAQLRLGPLALSFCKKHPVCFWQVKNAS